MASSHPFKTAFSETSKNEVSFFLRQKFSGNLNKAEQASQVSHRNGPVIMKYGFMVDILLWSNMVEAIIGRLIVTIAIVGSIVIGVGVTADVTKFKIGGGWNVLHLRKLRLPGKNNAPELLGFYLPACLSLLSVVENQGRHEGRASAL